MDNFEPSRNFVSRTMDNVRGCEMETAAQKERAGILALPKPVFAILSAGGILLGIFNLIRMALILISPALCM